MADGVIVAMESGNADSIRQVCVGVYPWAMLRYEAIAEFYTEEPLLAHVRLAADAKKETLEQVLRVRWCTPNVAVESWSVFCREREWCDEHDGAREILIRHVVWDRARDTERVRRANPGKGATTEVTMQAARQELVLSWPSLRGTSVYLGASESDQLMQVLLRLDRLLGRGMHCDTRSLEGLSGGEEPA